jgi:hypothetical protein
VAHSDNVTTLAQRADQDDAKAIAGAAISHAAWSALVMPPRVRTDRGEIIRAVNNCVGAIPSDALTELVEHVLPLAGERRQDHDFVEVINLLCHIAIVVGEPAKQRIRSELYRSGVGLPSVLVHVAPVLGQNISNANDQLAKVSSKVANYLGQLVQRVPLDAEAEKVPGTIFTYTAKGEHDKLVVHDIGTSDLEALSMHRTQLPKKSIDCLIAALIGAIREPQNSLTNRIQLTSTLGGVAESMDDELAEAAFQALSPAGSPDPPSIRAFWICVPASGRTSGSSSL